MNAWEQVLRDRISDLYRRRAWYATHLGWIPEQRVEDMAELRLLVRLARKARDLEPEGADPITAAGHDYWDGRLMYHDWQAAR